jgi:hypothetical protein
MCNKSSSKLSLKINANGSGFADITVGNSGHGGAATRTTKTLKNGGGTDEIVSHFSLGCFCQDVTSMSGL